MLIVPIEKGLDWSRAPVVTGLFVLLNCFIFLIWQTGDDSKIEDAIAFYEQSSLAKVEFPIYISHLHQYQQNELADQLEAAWKADNKQIVYGNILMDRSFNNFVNKTTLEFWGKDIYSSWKQDREILEQKVQSISAIKLGLIPGENKGLTYLTYQFLHGDIWHLLSNMIFLAIVGMGVEAAIGSFYFLVGYLVSGILAGMFYGMLTNSPFIPLVGASGSISALMGMYAVVYGLRKIKFFYFLIFYFGYFTAPALAILPVWILIEILQAIFNTDSYVAYWAHAGGLIAGSALLFVTKKWVLAVDETFYEPTEEEDDYRKDLNRVMQQIAQMNFDAANKAVAELLEKYPGDLTLLTQKYHLAKLDKDVSEIQPMLENILVEAIHQPHFEMNAETLLTDFLNKYPDAKLSQETRLKVLIYLISPETMDTAEKMLRTLINEKVEDPRVLKAVRTFIRHYEDKNDSKTLYRYQQLADALETKV
ncbi:MAG: rhomboid family intramembrane serine protease [Pseudomonadales bacterium]|nr:rhomboid family intramembrane serine protease [Pseudomonadales bacterium]